MEQIPFILRTYHKHNSKPYIKREIPGDLTYKKKAIWWPELEAK